MPRRKRKLPPCGEPTHSRGTCPNQPRYHVQINYGMGGGVNNRRVCGSHVRFYRQRGDATITEITDEEEEREET